MPQNEFNSAQIFPSCCWTSASLANFIGNYLGPAMQVQGVEIMFGTMERANESLVDTVLTDPVSGKYVKGVGFQWAGKGAIAGIHKRYPGLKLYQPSKNVEMARTIGRVPCILGVDADIFWIMAFLPICIGIYLWKMEGSVVGDGRKTHWLS